MAQLEKLTTTSSPERSRRGLTKKERALIGVLALTASLGTYTLGRIQQESSDRTEAEQHERNTEQPFIELSTDNPKIWMEGFEYNYKKFQEAESKEDALVALSHITLNPVDEYEIWKEGNLKPLATDTNRVVIDLQEGGTDFSSQTERRITFLYLAPEAKESEQYIYILRPSVPEDEPNATPEWLIYLP